MATVLSHGVAALALQTAFPVTKVPRRLWLLGIVCSMAPDVDVHSFTFGIPYGDLFGHRGFLALSSLLHSWAFSARW